MSNYLLYIFFFFFFRNSPVGHPHTPVSSTGPEIIDPQQRIREQESKIIQDMTSSELVQQARLMGFNDKLIKATLKW